MKSRFHEGAAADLAEAVSYYNEATDGLGDRMLSEVRTALAVVEAFPEAAPVLSGKLRGKGLTRFPHTLLYTVDEGEIIVLAFAHQRQDFRTWVKIVRAREESA